MTDRAPQALAAVHRDLCGGQDTELVLLLQSRIIVTEFDLLSETAAAGSAKSLGMSNRPTR